MTLPLLWWPVLGAAILTVARHLRLFDQVVAPALLGGNQSTLDELNDRPGLQPQPVGGFAGGEHLGNLADAAGLKAEEQHGLDCAAIAGGLSGGNDTAK